MTAYSYNFQRNRILVASDSAAYMPGSAAPMGTIDKISQLPKFHAVMLARGMFKIQVQAAAALTANPELIDLEDVAAELPDVLRQLTAQYAEVIGLDHYTDAVLINVILMGWSERDKRMKAWLGHNVNDFAMDTDDGQHYGVHAFPELPADYMPRIAGAASEKDLIAIISAARRYFAATPALGCIAGGEVQYVELTPTAMNHRTIHRFSDFESVRHQAAAVRQRFTRGDLDMLEEVRAGVTPKEDAVYVETSSRDEVVPLTRQQRRAAERAARRGQRAA